MPKNLLLADDSRTIQQAVRMTFAREDVRLTAVDDGEAALQAARESRPDLIIADVSMPRLGGYELCQRVRADAALKEVPVLLLGGGVPVDPAKAMAVGANGHMPKPFDSGKLIEQVKAILASPNAKPAATGAAAPPPPRPVAAPRPSGPPAARPSAPPPPRPSSPPAARPPIPAGAGIARTAPPARPLASAPPGAPRPGAPAAPKPSAPPGARPQAPLARPVAPPATRPPLPAAAKPGPAQARPAAAPPPAVKPATPPRPLARPPAPPAFDDEEIPVDEDLADEPPAAPPTPLRSVPQPHPSKPSLSVVPQERSADGGEAALREALSRASREVIEKIAWEVVPELAETIIREELERLMKERGA